MPIYKTLSQIALTISTLLLFTACSSKGPIDLKMQSEASPVVNRDVNGKSLSLVLHVYQLKSKDEFNRLTFDALASGKSASELLGNSLITQSEFVLLPGKENTLPFTLQVDTQYVGVVGFFRKPDAQFWRSLATAEEMRNAKKISIKAQDCFLQITSPKTELIPGQPAQFKTDCGSIQTKATKSK
jgi:type VI secretion system protein VasD